MDCMEKGIYLEDAVKAFGYKGMVAGALRFGKGHINDTFAVYTQLENGDAQRFILQRINTYVFKNPAQLMENVVGVTTYMRNQVQQAGGNPNRETLTLVPTREGGYLYTDPAGGVWRSYLFVENTAFYMVPQNPAVLQSAGQAFGLFNRRLQNYPAHTLHETIPNFHHTPSRLAALQAAVKQDKMGRAAECAAEIEFVMERSADCPILTDFLDKGELPLRVTHNDTKLSNILFDKTTGEGLCVVDLDTVMPGLSLYDFGDAIRSGAHNAKEDEKDLGIVAFSLPMYEAFTNGYLQMAGETLTALERELMPLGAKLMTLECGMRFLTDYLEGDVYFNIARPNHNLDRTRTQFKLVQGMEENWAAMHHVVQKALH